MFSTKYFQFFYSYLNAVIGSRLAAFLAGYHPKKMPVAAQTMNDIITDEMLTMNGQLRAIDIT